MSKEIGWTVEQIKYMRNAIKQEAIGFAEWIINERYFASEIKPGKWYQKPFKETSGYYTIEQLYIIYQQQNQKQ